MKNLLIAFLVLAFNSAFAQDNNASNNTHKGEFSFGVRSTGSMFSESDNYFGVGAGWHCRYRMSNNFSTEFFADWINTDVGGLGSRFDTHIGMSILIYPGKNPNTKGKLTPYVLGGFCADHTKITTNLFYDDVTKSYIDEEGKRLSFATQLGLGTHFNITEKFDISFTGQYILHFGKDIHSEIETGHNGGEHLHVHSDGDSLEGHFFLTLSANFVIVDFLKSK